MQVKIFGKEGCAKCQTTKNKFNHFISKWNLEDKVEVVFYDMDTVEGMAEGAYIDVVDIPVTILEKNGQQLARWDGEVPKSTEFESYLKDEDRP